MAQTVSRRALTVESRVRSKVILCEICGELGGIGTGFSTSQHYSVTATYSFHQLSLMLYSEQQTASVNSTLHRETDRQTRGELLGIKSTLNSVLITHSLFKGRKMPEHFLKKIGQVTSSIHSQTSRHTADMTQGSAFPPLQHIQQI